MNIIRSIFLFLSKSKALTKLARKYGLRFGASRFVAGETLEEAVRVIKKLNDNGLSVTVDYLGEFVDQEEEAEQIAAQCIEVIKAIHKEKLDAQLSVKLTSLGLDLSEDFFVGNFRKILDLAKKLNVFVTIDMEDFARCEDTLQIYKKLKKEYPQIGTVLQAYLYRTEYDIKELIKHQASLRLVKGAYKEPEEVAFRKKQDVDENFRKLIQVHLDQGYFTAIATHDEAIIDFTKEYVSQNEIPKEKFEFQMLYGIRSELQQQLVNEGYPMRVYVPFGTDWFGFYMRRLAERPANIGFLIKNLFKK